MLKIYVFIVIAISLLSSNALSFDPWSKQDVGLEVGYQLIHLIDWGQTRQIARQPDKYYEINPILGRHPETSKVNAYMALSGLAHIAITHVLPQEYRPLFQGITILIAGGVVAHNMSIGLSVAW